MYSVPCTYEMLQAWLAFTDGWTETDKTHKTDMICHLQTDGQTGGSKTQCHLSFDLKA